MRFVLRPALPLPPPPHEFAAVARFRWCAEGNPLLRLDPTQFWLYQRMGFGAPRVKFV